MGMGSTINRPPAGGKGAMGVRPPMNVRPPVIQPGPGVGPRPPVGGKGGMPGNQRPITAFDPNQITTSVLGPTGEQKYTNQQMLDAFSAYKMGGTSPIPQTAAENFLKNALTTYGPQQIAQYYPNQSMPLQSLSQQQALNASTALDSNRGVLGTGLGALGGSLGVR